MWRAIVTLAVGGCGRVAFDLHDASPSSVVELAVGGKTSCARLLSGDVWCWGNNAGGLLGAGLTVPSSPLPVRVATTGPTSQLDLDDAGGAARLVAGGVIGWGFNDHGQLGHGDTTVHATPVATLDSTDAVDLTMGNHVLCVRRASGAVACAGDFTQLGDSSLVDRPMLGDVPGLAGVQALTSGAAHVCALLDTGAVRCWGANDAGQLGDGSLIDRATPVAGPAGPYTAITGGDRFTCGLRTDRGVDCWGLNDHGQLGDGTTTGRGTAAPVVGVANVTTVVAGAFHACALLVDRSLVCWGDDGDGELGDGAGAGISTAPVPVGLADVVEVSSRTDLTTCARTGDGAVWCWGFDNDGQIGDGTIGTTATIPTRVVGLPP